MHSLYPKLARQEALMLNVFDVLVHTKRQKPIEAVKKGLWVLIWLPFIVFCPLCYSLDFTEKKLLLLKLIYQQTVLYWEHIFSNTAV